MSLTDGLANTNQLLADAQRLNPAAAYCFHMSLHGQTDWYLPARDELNVLYVNRTAIGGLAANWYWSSSESSINNAWLQLFAGGSQAVQGKTFNTLYRLRCVRRVN